MEFSTGDYGGTAESPSRTSYHWIGVRPSLGILSERTPPTLNVVNRVGLNDLLCESYNANMPLFGSGAGSSAAGACAKSDEETSTGARPKEDAGRNATTDGAGPHKNDGSSREMSPRRDSPDLNRRRYCYALLFGVRQVDVETGPYVMPPYAWNKTVIKDILGTEVRGISDVIVINPGECLVFTGQRSKGHGFTQAEAMAFARELHDRHTFWIGRRVQMRCVPRTLKDAKADLKAAKEYLRQNTYEKLARSPARRSGESRDTPRQQTSPWDSDRWRGMVRRSDRYQAQQYLKGQPGGSRKSSAWPDTDGASGQATCNRLYDDNKLF